MEKNKTAVEWLFEKLWDEPKDKFTWYALRQKAIEIEKEKTEISDEEIDKSNPFRIDGGAYNSSAAYQWSKGAQWYREQLKRNIIPKK